MRLMLSYSGNFQKPARCHIVIIEINTSMKRFLIIQIRPEDEAADNELESFVEFGGLSLQEIHRVQADREVLTGINAEHYAGVIVGGGPANISDTNKSPPASRMEQQIFRLLDRVIETDTPYLGACYGLGTVAAHQGGIISKECYSEPVGAVTVTLTDTGRSDPLTRDLPSSFKAFGGHKEACQNLPPGSTLLASSESCPIQMIRFKQNIYATQFHPELDTHGIVVRINVYKHAGYFPADEADSLIAKVREEEVTVPVRILQNFINRYR